MAKVCRCCGRVLTDPVSVELGIGPICATREQADAADTRQGNLFGPRWAKPKERPDGDQ